MTAIDQEISRLRSALAEALEENRQMKEVMRGDRELYNGLPLTKGQLAVITALMDSPGICSHARLFMALAAVERPAVDRGQNNISVMIFRLRRKFAPFGICIENEWGSGYSMTPASKALLRKLNRQVVRP